MRTTKLEMELRAYAICDATDDFRIRCSVIHAKAARSRHLYTYRCARRLGSFNDVKNTRTCVELKDGNEALFSFGTRSHISNAVVYCIYCKWLLIPSTRRQLVYKTTSCTVPRIILAVSMNGWHWRSYMPEESAQRSCIDTRNMQIM